MSYKVAYSGIEGAFANIAAKRVFPGEELIPFKDFSSAFEAVENGECDYAILPIENSYAGEIGQVNDLIFRGNLFINDVYGLKIEQNLLGIKGASLSDIKKVISHPQALEQGAVFLKKHGIETVTAENTARAAKQVADLNEKHIGAVASLETAALYGLDVIQKNINEAEDNTTRFAILSKKAGPLNNKIHKTQILMFTVKNETGALVGAINIIAGNGLNMGVLRSRPLKGLAWQYYFYVEADALYESEEFQKTLEQLKQYCQTLRHAGSYSKD